MHTSSRWGADIDGDETTIDVGRREDVKPSLRLKNQQHKHFDTVLRAYPKRGLTLSGEAE
jgi:hypothetical protein